MKECSLHRITLCMYEIVYSAHGQTLISNIKIKCQRNCLKKQLIYIRVLILHTKNIETERFYSIHIVIEFFVFGKVAK